ncbi:RmlC-like cupin domain-containing protein, partial [Jimgerdemannia flammicorona]
MSTNPHIIAFLRRTLSKPTVHPNASARLLSTATTAAAMPTIVARRSKDRGHANHGWLDSYHTFNFADYYDPKFHGFGSLRVINEDIVKPGFGFGKHPHKVFEIFSYLLSGELEHKDSMGHTEVLKRGDVQFTSAGTGIFHSEHNASKSRDNGVPVNFLQ